MILDPNSYKLVDRKEALMTAERLIIKDLGFELSRLMESILHRSLLPLVKGVEDSEFI